MMTAAGRRFAVVALAVALPAVVMAVGAGRRSPPPVTAVVGVAATTTADDPLSDPFPIRRVFLPADNFEPVAAAAGRGAYRRWPKEVFESEVQAAARAQADASTPPVLAAAVYRGTYSGGSLRGSIAWTVVNPCGRPGPLPLDPLRVAVEQPRWADGREAVLFRGRLSGKELTGTYLWVDDPGGTAAADWSARGVEEPDVERFDLGFPASPMAALELTLPADRVPVVTAARAVTTGPFPAATAGCKLWRIAFGGSPGLSVGVRRPVSAAAADVVASRTARYDLTPGEVRAAIEFGLEVVRGAGQEFRFAVDPRLRVADVTGDLRDRWRFQAGDPATAPGSLTVWLREPATAAKLTVIATAALPTGRGEWSFPLVTAAGGMPGADVLEATVHPDLRLDGWHSADYRLTVTGLTPDRSVRLQFHGSWVGEPGAARRPPAVRLRPAGVQVATDEALEWRLEPGRVRLSAQLGVRVVRGPLEVLDVTCEPGYTLDAATLTPTDPGMTVRPTPGTPGGWLVEPSRAIPTGQEVSVRLDFRGPAASPGGDPGDSDPTPVPVPFPRFEVGDAVERQGQLSGVGVGAMLSGRSVLPVVAVSPSAFAVAYRGRPPAGEGLFTPERPAVELTDLEIGVTDRTAAIRCDAVSDEPVGGFHLLVPGPAGAVHVDGADARSLPEVDAVAWFGGASGWQAVATAGAAAAERRTLWRVRFRQPTRGRFLVRFGYPVTPAALDLPMPTLIGFDAADPTVKLTGDLAGRFDPDAAEAFRPGAPRLRLIPRGAAVRPDAARPAAWGIRDVRLASTVTRNGDTAVTLSGRLAAAGGPVFPVGLPAGATVESVRVADKWVTAVAGADRLDLPVPEPSAGGLPFEVRYRLTAIDSGWSAAHRSPLPELPTDPPVDRSWSFAPGWLPWPALRTDTRVYDADGEVRVVSASTAWAVGALAAGLVGWLGFRVATRGGRVAVGAVVGLTAAGGVAQFVPSDGWRAVSGPAFAVGLLSLLVVTARRRPTLATGVAAVAVATGVGADPPAPATVFVMADGDRLAVYAPAAVTDRLAALAGSPLPELVITRAEYRGVAGEATATFDAEYTLRSHTGGPHAFALPLAGVRLESATLDGTDAHPDASRPDRYTVRVAGVGVHRLRLRFGVPPVAVGRDREARFAVPDVPCSTVVFRTGAGGVRPDVSSRRGSQDVTTAGAVATATADHGGGRTLTVRWHEPVATATPPAFAVREAGVWDVTETEAGVVTAVVFRPVGGPTDVFRLELPDGVRPVRLVARTLDRRAAAVAVRGWAAGRPADGWVPLEVRLQQPTAERVVVVVRAVPTTPLATTPTLRFPRAAGVPDADRDTLAAVRFGGAGVRGVSPAGAIDFPPDALLKDFPAVPEFGFDRAVPNRVVRRVATAEPAFRPVLATAVPPTRSAEAVYTVGRWAEAEGTFRATGKEIGHLEFDVSAGVDVRDVRAAGLGGWSRTGERVQVWFRQPTADVTVRWAGTLPAADGRAAIAVPRWADQAESVAVRVRAAAGWTVEPEDRRELQPKPVIGTNEYAYTAAPGTPPLRFVVRPAPPAAKPNEPSPAAPAAPPQVDSQPPTVSESSAPPSAGDDGQNWYHLGRAGAWLVGFGLIYWCWDRRRVQRPEAVLLFGLLGGAAAGDTTAGWLFGGVAVAAAVVRLWIWTRRPNTAAA